MKIVGFFFAFLVVLLVTGGVYLGLADVSVPQETVTVPVSASPQDKQ